MVFRRSHPTVNFLAVLIHYLKRCACKTCGIGNVNLSDPEKNGRRIGEIIVLVRDLCRISGRLHRDTRCRIHLISAKVTQILFYRIGNDLAFRIELRKIRELVGMSFRIFYCCGLHLYMISCTVCCIQVKGHLRVLRNLLRLRIFAVIKGLGAADGDNLIFDPVGNRNL